MSTPLHAIACLSLSFALGVAGCSKPSEDTEAKPNDDTKAEGDDTPAKGETKSPTTPPPDTKPANDGSLAAAVESMIDAEASYPIELDPLLDLVPEGSEEFLVIRDIDDLLAIGEGTLTPIGPSLRSFAAAAEAGGSSPDAKANVAKVLDGFQTLTTSLRGSEFSIDKGLVMSDIDGDKVVIYGTGTPDALPTLGRALGLDSDNPRDACTAIEAAPGYAICAEDEATLSKYVPGKAAAVLQTKVSEQIDEADVSRANVLGRVGRDEGKPVVFAIATPSGLLHLTVGIPEAPEEFTRLLGSGQSPAIGLAAPGSAFYWAQLDPAALAEQAASGPFMMKGMLTSMTGELFMGTLATPESLVMLAGVSDPGPAGGMVALAGTQLDKVPTSLPDGSSLEVKLETLTVGGADTQVLHGTMTPAGQTKEIFESMGLTPEAWMFSVGGYAGIAIGGGKKVVETIASYRGGGPSSEAAKAMPKPLAQGLVDRKVSVAMHMSLDGLQSPQTSETMDAMLEEIPTDGLPPGLSAEQLIDMVRTGMAPISGTSFWMAPPKDHMVIHVAFSLLGDPRSEEGKAALTALSRVAEGGDAGAIYGALAAAYPGSDRRAAYQTRAGTSTTGVLSTAALLGAMAAIAIPAFVKYSERSKAAAATIEMPPTAEPGLK